MKLNKSSLKVRMSSRILKTITNLSCNGRNIIYAYFNISHKKFNIVLLINTFIQNNESMVYDQEM